MRWFLAVLFFCSACESKPVATEETATKVSREASMNKAEYAVKVETSPRRAPEMEAGILGNPEIQKCFDMSAAHDLGTLNVMLEGNIKADGALENPVLSKAGKGFELCMNPALRVLNLGKGKAGAFKMQIFRKDGKNQIKKLE